MESTRVVVNDPVGLHARPAALFVKKAQQFNADIKVANVTRGGAPVNAKSILSVLTIAVGQGNEIELTAEGDDAEDALAALVALIENDFEAAEAE